MLKLFIPLPKLNNQYGEVVLDARHHRFHLFLNEDLHPNMKQVGYLNRVHQNKITECVTFDYVTLQSERKVFRQGYALIFDAVKADFNSMPTPLSCDFSWHSAVSAYKHILKAGLVKMSDIEKIIILNHSFSDDHKKRYKKEASLNVHIHVALRMNEGDKYIYYDIPDERSVEINYIPGKDDIAFYAPDNVTVIPYTKETYDKLCIMIDESIDCVQKMRKQVKSLI